MSTAGLERQAQQILEEGNALFVGPQWRRSEALYRTALRLFTDLGDQGRAADCLCNLASVAWRLRDLPAADDMYAQAKEQYEAIGSTWAALMVEVYQGNVAYHRGDLHRAGWLYERAVNGLDDGAHELDVADVEVNLAGLLSDLGDSDRAVDLLTNASLRYQHHLSGADLRHKLADVDQNLGCALMETGQHVVAWNALRRALRVVSAEGDRDRQADLLHNLANLAARMRRWTTAEGLYRSAVSIYEATDDDRRAGADCLLGLGGMRWRRGDPEGARAALEDAVRIFTGTQEWLALARAVHNLALTGGAGQRQRTDELVAAWLAMHSIAWGLPFPAARARWRQTLESATSEVLDGALEADDAVLVAEVVEALRSAPLDVAAALPTGISPRGTTIHDFPTRRPALVRVLSGTSPLLRPLARAEQIRNVGGTDIRLRTTVVDLRAMLDG